MATMVLPQVLYDSLLHRFQSTITYDGTTVDGYDDTNAVDWRDFSLFRASVGTTNLKIQSDATVRPVDTLAVWWLAHAGTATIYVETSPDDSAWTTVATQALAQAGGIAWLDFAAANVPSSGWLRVRIVTTVALDFRQISVGQRLEFPVGQWNGIAPPTLYSGVVVDNVTAVNGSIIGRNVRRLEKSGKLDINLLDPSWVRDSFDPFNRHAGRYAFWYRWHPVGYPTEVAFAAANDIVAPVNERPRNKMKIEMPMRLLTA